MRGRAELPHSAGLLAAAGLLLCAVGVLAQSDGAAPRDSAGPSDSATPRGSAGLCAADTGIPERPQREKQAEPGAVYIDADDASLAEEGVSHLRGNVQISSDTQQARADEVFYRRAEKSAEFKGEVRFWDEKLYLHSDSADVDLQEGSGLFTDTDYYLYESRARGRAEELFIDVGEITRGKRMSFTTCDPAAPGWDFDTDTWRLSARELTLNHETDRGSGKHLLLTIKKIPVFYSPYLTFPLSDKRKSGFLTPFIGTSSNGGAEVQTPFYWNIAPNLDATLTPRIITDRGLMAMGELRYLSETMRGALNLEYLLDDDLYRNRDRNLVRFEHRQRLFGRGRLNLIYNRVSDPRYFEDLGAQLGSASQRFLPRHVDFDYNGFHHGANWALSARVRDYQTVDQSIDVTSKPYRQLPRVRLRYRPLAGNKRLNLNLRSEVVYFERSDEAGLIHDATGLRADIFPTLSYPYRAEAGYFIPAVGLRYTQYSLKDAAPLFRSAPSRVLPVVSVDSGLFFDRYTNLFNAPYLHTLEPRLHYLYIPRKDQSDLPVFDTGLYNLSYTSLFLPDRFTGPDRMGDANRVTAAITSRLINRASGVETGFIRVAQSYHLADRNVIRQRIENGRLVDNGLVDTDFYSPVIAELRATFIDNWTFGVEFQWQPGDNTTQKLGAQAQYRSADDKVLNFGYRGRRGEAGLLRRNLTDIDQTDMSLHWPLGRQWSVVGRWNYAVSERRSLEMFAGVEYDSCCFAARAVARRFLTNIDGDFNNGFFLQFELKGLAGLGRRTAEFLQQSIPGYQDRC